MTLEELNKIKEQTLPQLSLRVNQCPIKVYVAAGDSGIKAGSRMVLQEALNLVYDLGLQNVMVTQMPACPEGQTPYCQFWKTGDYEFAHCNAGPGRQCCSGTVIYGEKGTPDTCNQ